MNFANTFSGFVFEDAMSCEAVLPESPVTLQSSLFARDIYPARQQQYGPGDVCVVGVELGVVARVVSRPDHHCYVILQGNRGP